MINYIPDNSPEDNAARMEEEITLVKTGQVTYAVRDTVIDDKEIRQDDYMGIGDKSILSVGTDLEATTLDMVSQLVDEDSAIVTIYYGEDIQEKHAQKAADLFADICPDADVNLLSGGQPVYYYLISAE